jgi:hypothetical protein
MIAKWVVIVSIALGAIGCASMPKGDPQKDAALAKFLGKPEVAGVYIYCDEWMGAVFFTNVEVDGAPLGQISSHTYLHTEVPPGRHTVTSTAVNADTVEFDAEAGKIVYIWQEKKWGFRPLPDVKLHVMSEVDGQQGIRHASFRVASHRTEDQSGAKFTVVAGTAALAIFTGLLVFVIPGAGAAALMAGAH